MTAGESGRQESQEQSEVDHGDFEMVVSFAPFTLLNSSVFAEVLV